MARGVTQEQVNVAIDTLVAAGERPTIERVRAALGTGSPNTLTRMLDTWWAALGNRLAVQQEKVALPDAPAEVAALASQLWEQALRAARADECAALQGDRTQLEAEKAQLASERTQLQQRLESNQQAVTVAQQAQSIAETRLADAQQLAERHGQQLADVLHQRDALQTRVDQLVEELTVLGSRLQHHEAAAAVERTSHTQHLRAVEDRSHIEVDRARQETKDLRVQYTVQEREHAICERQRDEARVALVAAQRDAAGQRARSEALEQQLARLGELHATLQSTLAQSRGTQAPRRTAARKSAKTRIKHAEGETSTPSRRARRPRTTSGTT